MATTDGYLYCYQVEAEGGECTLARQHKIGVQVSLPAYSTFLTVNVMAIYVWHMYICLFADSVVPIRSTKRYDHKFKCFQYICYGGLHKVDLVPPIISQALMGSFL